MTVHDKIKKYERENNKIWAIRKMSKDQEIVEYFNNKYPSYEFKHQYRFYCKGLETEPLCLNCNQILRTPETAIYCSHHCRASHEIKTGKIKDRQAKKEETNLKKYGTRNYSNTEKQKQTLKTRTREQKQSALKKKKDTCLRKYGVESYSKTKDFVEKSMETKNKKYSDPYFSNREKAKQTCVGKYGVEHHMQVTEIKNKVANVLSKPNHINLGLLNEREQLKEIYDSKGIVGVSKKLNSSESYANRMLRRLGIDVIHRITSKFEDEINEYITTLGHTTERNNRTILNGKEIDILLPNSNIAFECNGVYWHTHENNTAKDYHCNKTDMCKDQGIQLVHITDIDWDNKRDIIKSRIKSLLGDNRRIFARKCEIVSLDHKTTKEFLDRNHIQGSCPGSIRYGLMYNGDLVGVMTFGKSRFDKNVSWELLRYCTVQGVNITGGASKLLTKFLKEYSGDIISYSNRDWNTGNLYSAIGFSYEKTSPPNVFYTRDFMILESRHAFQKHKLQNKLEIYDDSLTAKENILANKYFSYYDSGNDVWIYRR